MQRSTPPPTQAAIYLRVSLDATGEGLAVERQREDCERIARDRGWAVVETYVDNSISAYDKAKVRPAYDRMVNDYGAGRFTALVCWDLDRLTRQPRQLEDWIDAAEDRGLALVTANGEADLGTDGGRMYARIKAAVARAEVERKGKRQSRAQLQRAEKGRAPRGVRATGYTLDGEEIASEAAAIRAVFASFAAGASLRGIAAALSGDARVDSPDAPVAVPSLPARNGQSWNPSSVSTILRNPRYAGWSMLAGEIVRDANGAPIRGQWPALVSDEVWLDVQRRLDDPARKTNRVGTARKHLGSGLYHCGHEIEPGKRCGKAVKAHGTRYRCAGHVLRSRANVDEYVLRVLELRLSRPDARELLATDNREAVANLRDEMAHQRDKIARAKNDYRAELIDGPLYKEIHRDAQAEIDRLETERIALAGNAAVEGILSAPHPGRALRQADLSSQRAAIAGLATVTLFSAPRGHKGFDPRTVDITWHTA